MFAGVITGLLLLFALLAIPITLTYQVSWPRTVRNETILQWAFGLVRVRLPAKTDSADDRKSGQKTGDSERSFGNARNGLAAIQLKPFRRRIMRFVGDAWRAVRKACLCLIGRER